MKNYPLVTPREEREWDSVPGPFYVTKQCIICGLSPETAPTNITWDERYLQSECTGRVHHCRVSKQPETDEEVSKIIKAAKCSCVEAIRYCGTDPDILKRFAELGLSRLCDAL
jgi:hypothetical protein